MGVVEQDTPKLGQLQNLMNNLMTLTSQNALASLIYDAQLTVEFMHHLSALCQKAQITKWDLPKPMQQISLDVYLGIVPNGSRGTYMWTPARPDNHGYIY